MCALFASNLKMTVSCLSDRRKQKRDGEVERDAERHGKLSGT